MHGKARILSHGRNGGRSVGRRGGNHAKQSQFVDARLDCNRLSVTQLRRGGRDCPCAKTKPIPGVEIASSAFSLLAMTAVAVTCSPGDSSAGRMCKTKPISGGPNERQALVDKRVVQESCSGRAVQNKANLAEGRRRDWRAGCSTPCGCAPWRRIQCRRLVKMERTGI